MSPRPLRSVRARRDAQPGTPARPAARLPLVAVAVLAAGLTAACGTSSPPVGAAAASVAGSSPQAPSSETPSADASVSASASASGQASPSTSPPSAPSASASTPAGSSPTPSRTRTAATPSRTPSQPPRTSAAPAPARIPGPGYDSSVGQAQVDAALRAAKADGRMVLLDFGANWCGNCKAADKVFAQPQTAALLGESYHLVKVDIGGSSSAASALLSKYSPGGGSYKMPVLVVLSPSGTVRTDTHTTGNPSLTAEGINSFLRRWAS
ncbi:thioredoxin family protein [Streptomyces sp. NPDC057939]|uniref:thioredoxin family protein n=1 Tax=Streptomyces sp. NPDC057939 TaxID=3346284 RepID=UPI0036EFFD3C